MLQPGTLVAAAPFNDAVWRACHCGSAGLTSAPAVPPSCLRLPCSPRLTARPLPRLLPSRCPSCSHCTPPPSRRRARGAPEGTPTRSPATPRCHLPPPRALCPCRHAPNEHLHPPLKGRTSACLPGPPPPALPPRQGWKLRLNPQTHWAHGRGGGGGRAVNQAIVRAACGGSINGQGCRQGAEGRQQGRRLRQLR